MDAVGGHQTGGYAATLFIFIFIIMVMIEDINLAGEVWNWNTTSFETGL